MVFCSEGGKKVGSRVIGKEIFGGYIYLMERSYLLIFVDWKYFLIVYISKK